MNDRSRPTPAADGICGNRPLRPVSGRLVRSGGGLFATLAASNLLPLENLACQFDPDQSISSVAWLSHQQEPQFIRG